MNKQTDISIKNTIQNTSIGLELYIFRLLFAVLRPVRIKYNLSINLILALNSCYLYSKLEKSQFYMTDIYKFNKYYSIPVMKRYIAILTLRGFIASVSQVEYRPLYYITASGIEVIESIEQYYSKELYLFADRYHLEL